MKIAATWAGALLLGFIGGLAGQRLSTQPLPPALASSHRAAEFELTDRSGRVVSVWTTDQWGRPYLGMSDAKWEGRVIIGPILASDVVDERPKWDAWGIEVTAPGRTAHAWLGTTIPMNAQQATGFISLQGGHQTWSHEANR